MKNFSECLGLSPQVLTSLERMKFDVPTPIQAQAIPLALQGKDILGSAQTGTGKTGAFAIPLVSKLFNNEIQGALVLTPTRELAVQVSEAIQKIVARQGNVHMALLIGGQDFYRQLSQLRKNPKIIVATPGRLNDHLERKTVNLKNTNYLVLDETDRMLDMGFGHQIDRIVAQMPTDRQTLMFSATMPKNIQTIAAKYLKNPERIQVGSCLQPIESIVQESIRLADHEKYDQLVKELNKREGSVVVFVKTKFSAQKIADRLDDDFLEAQAIHGNLRQNKRDRIMQEFRNKKFRILVATDVAARGLDVSHIELVVNHDLPQCPEDYIHRIGRTARAGAKGSAVNFITRGDDRLWRAIERFMKTGQQDSSSGYGERKSSGGSFGGGDSRGDSRGGRRGGNGGGRRFGGRGGNGGGRRFGSRDRNRSSSGSSSFGRA